MAVVHEESRHKPKEASVQLYDQLSKDYHIRLACDQCAVTNPKDPLVRTYRELPKHHCMEHMLLLQNKTEAKSRENWTLVRSKPRPYYTIRGSQDGDICESVLLEHQCPDGIDCGRAHSQSEHYVWVTKIDLSVFIDDVRTSSLLLQSFVTRVCKLHDGRFEFICRQCFLTDSKISSKKQRVVEFECGHTGIECKLLIFRSKNEPDKIVTLETDRGAISRDDFRDIASEWALLKANSSFTDDEIFEESRRSTQANDSTKHSDQSNPRKIVTEDDYDLPEDYADQIEHGHVHIIDANVFDDYESVQNHVQLKRNIDNSDFIVAPTANQKDTYYKYVPVDQLEDNLKKPDVYKRCHIALKNHDNAECRIINTTYEAGEEVIDTIEARGRRNCGQCFSGDEVLVEILKDVSKERKVPLGRVVGVFKHGIDCRSHVFVCSSLNRVPNLMTQIRGSAPRIRVVDALIAKKYKNQRQSLIEVFDAEFKMRHIARLPQDVHRSQILFLVKLHSWNSRNDCPLGYVTGILKSSEALEDELKLLNIEYQIPWLNENETLSSDKELSSDEDVSFDEELSSSKELLSDEKFPKCVDRKVRCAITIDSNDTKCFDDAFTVKELTGSIRRVLIGVHITDVTRHVAIGSEPDKRAAEIMEDYYKSKRIKGVYPNRRLFKEVRGICSLKEGPRERDVISVYLTVDRSSGEIFDSDVVTSSRIIIIKNLYFKKVQQIINNPSADSDMDSRVVEQVLLLHAVAVKMRRERMKEACHFYDDRDLYPDAKRLVEEFSLRANRTVTELLRDRLLRGRLPGHPLPLRRQLPPSRQHIENWNQSHSDMRYISFYFARPDWFSGIPKVTPTQNEIIYVSKSTRDKLLILSGDDARVCAGILREHHFQSVNVTSRSALTRRIIGSEDLHPKHEIARRDWFKINKRAEFVCSSSVLPDNWRHFDMNFDCYVQFTSPLRRYLDLVVQRILKSLLLNDENPYETEDIRDLCSRANSKQGKVKMHKTCVEEIDLLKDFKDRGVPVTCAVAEFDDSGLVLSFSNLLINYRHVSIRMKPVLDDKGVKLTWELRRFNVAESNTRMPRHCSPSYEVSKESWMNVRNAIACLNEKGVLSKLTMKAMQFSEGLVQRFNDRMGRICKRFSSTIQAGTNLEIQFGNYGISTSGTRELQIELLYFPNNLDFCLLHSQHPVECLSCSSAYSASTKETYMSVEQYQGTWLPILSLESATNAVRGVGDTIVCENVPLRIASAVGPPYRATLTLQKSFCMEHHIEFLLRKPRLVRGRPDPVQDYLCLRSNTGLTTPAGPLRVWVAHGLITSFETRDSTSIEVSCSLHQFNFPLPQNYSGGHCTVEFLIKNLTDRRRETAVRSENMKDLCKSIILNNEQRHRFAASWPESKVKKLTNGLEETTLNAEQRDAIQKALGHKFYLIHGPPGTGKTVAGVHLVRCLVELNKERERSTATKCQVLYCGPSNSSVDVAARKLLDLFGSQLSVIRVYSKTRESEDFDNPAEDIVKSRSLHRLIRQTENTTTSQEYSSVISSYERKHGRGVRVWNKAARLYNKSLRKAEALQLNSCDVIFCTLVMSASRNIVSMTHVRQVVIDECGMSAEPDCLIALTSFPQIEQVILIGDHKQLQPIVLNYDAKKLGLGKSLFERYAGSRRRLTMLKTQYRMHDSICQFPSDYFYQGNLKTDSSASNSPVPPRLKWPAGKQHRIVFCHVNGKEENQKVETADGNIFSKYNREEQKKVIQVVAYLVKACKIPAYSIAVLSQYKAQCSQLMKRLESSTPGVHISTVVAGQGKEWEYVILSTVRSLPSTEIDLNPSKQWLSNQLGIVADPHQLNVALTRAKNGLIIIGNKHLLRAADMWSQLLDHYEEVDCLLNADEYPKQC